MKLLQLPREKYNFSYIIQHFYLKVGFPLVCFEIYNRKSSICTLKNSLSMIRILHTYFPISKCFYNDIKVVDLAVMHHAWRKLLKGFVSQILKCSDIKKYKVSILVLWIDSDFLKSGYQLILRRFLESMSRIDFWAQRYQSCCFTWCGYIGFRARCHVKRNLLW